VLRRLEGVAGLVLRLDGFVPKVEDYTRPQSVFFKAVGGLSTQVVRELSSEGSITVSALNRCCIIRYRWNSGTIETGETKSERGLLQFLAEFSASLRPRQTSQSWGD